MLPPDLALGMVFGLTALGRLAVMARVWIHSFRLPRVVATHPLENGPACSVLIPARDEEETIGPCLASLMDQHYRNLEVLVVDDDSSDGTARIVRDAVLRDVRIRYFRAPTLPDGWTGKNFALAWGAGFAKGSWLLFTDADTWHAPSALGTALAYARDHGLACLSLSPEQECRSFWERVVQPVVYELLDQLYPMAEVNRPGSRAAAAHGAFILIRREVYEAIGGHGAVRGELVEDVALARAMKERGGALGFAPGRGLVRSRMYRSLPHLHEGWTKNLYLLAGGHPARALWVTGVLLCTGCIPSLIALSLVGSAAAGMSAGPLLPWAIGITIILFVLDGVARRTRGLDARVAWSHPLGALLVALFLAESAYRNLTGRGVTWKARVYPRGSPWQS